MSRFDIDQMQIATPCTADWNSMKGDNRSRHCQECKLNVYNVENLTRAETESLLEKAASGQRVCMRFFKRQDGTVITKDCPIGVRIARRLKVKMAALRLVLSSLIFGGSAALALEPKLIGKMVPTKHGTGHFGGIQADPNTTYRPPKRKTLKEYEAEPLVGELSEPADASPPAKAQQPAKAQPTAKPVKTVYPNMHTPTPQMVIDPRRVESTTPQKPAKD